MYEPNIASGRAMTSSPRNSISPAARSATTPALTVMRRATCVGLARAKARIA